METKKLELGGLRSSILVDGADVSHHGIEYEGLKVTSWIVSERDKPFSIHVDLLNRAPGCNYVVRFYLDGHKVEGFVFRPQDPPCAKVSSTRISPTATRSFMFGSIELSDDDALLETSFATAQLGEIKILYSRVGTVVQTHSSYQQVPQAQKVHERSKKGLAHSVKYGETKLDPQNPLVNSFVCGNETFIASHTIKYRPLAMLQANEIIPYTPDTAQNMTSPTSSSSAPGPSSSGNPKKRKAPAQPDVKPVIVLSDDEDEDIVSKETRLKAQLAQLQHEKARRQGLERPAKKIKKETMKPIVPGEVIDLTL